MKKQLAMVMVVGIVLVTIGGCGGPRKASPNPIHAESICEQAVSQQLKDPNSADFLDDRVITPTGAAEWNITGTVVATNSFGGPVRISYDCDAWTKDNDLYEARAKLTE